MNNETNIEVLCPNCGEVFELDGVDAHGLKYDAKQYCRASTAVGDDPYFAVCKLPVGHEGKHQGRGYEW